MGQYFENQQLPSNVRKVKVHLFFRDFYFYTDNGVFSKDGLDFGSRLLLESIPLDEVGGKVLDMGCGYGVFGIILNKITSCYVDMVDVNLRALHLAKRIFILSILVLLQILLLEQEKKLFMIWL